MAADESSYTMDPNRTAPNRGEMGRYSPSRTHDHLTSNGDVADLRIDFEPDQMGFFPSGSLKREHYSNQHEPDVNFDEEAVPHEIDRHRPAQTVNNDSCVPAICVSTNGSNIDIPGNERLDVTVAIDDDACFVDEEGKKRWRCNQCPKVYSSKHNLMTHVLGHSGIKPHACQECGKLFKQLSHLNTHMLVHGGVRPHRCQVCDKSFTQSSHLKRHMMQHTESRPHTCGICGRGFAYPSELKSHEAKHADSKDNICVECGAEFLSLAMLKRHLATHRGPNSYQCSECDKTFMYPSQLNNHLMKHRDIRPHICSECGMEFFQIHHLKQHALTHRGVKEHKCPICGREFTLHANMKRHLQIHSNSRDFRCTVCGRAFNQRQTLKAHMVTHSEVKPYKCKVCGKEFTRFHNLSGHMHLHSDSKPFKCSHCNSKFTLKGNLMRHLKVKHGIDATASRAAISARMGDGEENSEDNSMHMSDDMEESYEGNTDEGMDTSFSSGGPAEDEEDLEEEEEEDGSFQEQETESKDSNIPLRSEGEQVDNVSSQPPIFHSESTALQPAAASLTKEEPISPPIVERRYLDMSRPHNVSNQQQVLDHRSTVLPPAAASITKDEPISPPIVERRYLDMSGPHNPHNVPGQPPFLDHRSNALPPTTASITKDRPTSPPVVENRYHDMSRHDHAVDQPHIDMSLLYRSQPGPKPRVPQKFECALCPTRFTQRGNMLRHMRQKHWEEYQRTYVRADPEIQHPPPSPPNLGERNMSYPPLQGVKNEPMSPLIGQPSQYFMSSTPVSGLPHNLPRLHFKKRRHLAGGDHWDVNVYLKEAVDSIPPPTTNSTDRTQYGYPMDDYCDYDNTTPSNESDTGWTPPIMDLPKGLHV
ncbi:zinc finger protein 366-like [Branchiostoma lanceolatum]|uniref:zinc finger protein 366-like n=1 Tax=Branchiostoma lanceolatum TaxID=7740 RepID=UPI0034549B31